MANVQRRQAIPQGWKGDGGGLSGGYPRQVDELSCILQNKLLALVVFGAAGSTLNSGGLLCTCWLAGLAPTVPFVFGWRMVCKSGTFEDENSVMKR